MNQKSFTDKIKTDYFLKITGVLLLCIGVFLTVTVVTDNSKLTDDIIKSKKEINDKITNYNFKLDTIYRGLKVIDTNGVTNYNSKSELLMLKQSGLILQKELGNFKSQKEDEIKELYVSQIKTWMYLIGILTSIVVFTGLKFNIAEKRKELIERLTKEHKDSITEYAINFTEKHKESITEFAKNKSWEFELMKESNIIVINPNRIEDAKNLSPVLKWFKDKGGIVNGIYGVGFNQLDKLELEVNEFIKQDKHNIVLLENSDGGWSLRRDTDKGKDNIAKAAEIALKFHKDAMLLYFGPKEVGDFPNRVANYTGFFEDEDYKKLEQDIEQNKDNEQEKSVLEQQLALKKKNNKTKINAIIDHISFANTPSKLYPNLIDALKYLDILNPQN